MIPRVIAVATDAGIELRLYHGDTLAEAVQLEPRRALLLTLDLLTLVAGRELTIERIAYAGAPALKGEQSMKPRELADLIWRTHGRRTALHVATLIKQRAAEEDYRKRRPTMLNGSGKYVPGIARESEKAEREAFKRARDITPTSPGRQISSQ